MAAQRSQDRHMAAAAQAKGRILVWEEQPDDSRERYMARVKEMFRSYFRILPPEVLSWQACDAEIDALPGQYARKNGGILLVYVDADDVVLGCVALRTLGETVGELKRLWVDARARGRGLGEVLCRAALAHAAGPEFDFERLYLDTLTRLNVSALYRRLGFVPCEAYNENPMPDAEFFVMEKDNIRTYNTNEGK